MNIQCPKCRQVVPANQVNMGTDLAFCPSCNAGFKISESIDAAVVNADVLRDPPQGAWFRKELDHVVVGATTRSRAAFFMVPFTCIWAGGSLAGIYGSQLMNGKFDLHQSLFGIPFLIGSVFLIGISLMTIWGKVEVIIGRESCIFTGIGRIGRRRFFDWTTIQAVREDLASVVKNGKQQKLIELVADGEEPVRFGTMLSDNRRRFLLNALKYLRSQSR